MFMVPGGFGHVLRRSLGVIWGDLWRICCGYLEGPHMHTQKVPAKLSFSHCAEHFWRYVLVSYVLPGKATGWL
jgi:hypothetical protein